jgi:hypothetical protein
VPFNCANKEEDRKMNQYLAILAGAGLLTLLAWVHVGIIPNPSILIKSAIVDTRNSPIFSMPKNKSKCPRYGKPT